MDDQNTPSEPAEDTTAPEAPESAPAPVEPNSGQITASDTANMPPEAPESPINDDSPPPVPLITK